MRTLPPLLALALLAGCGREETVITGRLEEGSGVSHVWLLGDTARARVDGDSFRISGALPDTADLRFADADGEVGRMLIRGAAEGVEIRLGTVWISDGRAFPGEVEVDGAEQVTIDRLRYGAPGDGAVDAAGSVLAVSRAGEAMIVRPVDAALPDLRVVVTPGTRVVSPDGDPLGADGVEIGDSVRVRGTREGGYLVATEVVLPRRVAGRAGSGGGEEGNGDGAADDGRKGRSEGKGRGRGRGRDRG